MAIASRVVTVGATPVRLSTVPTDRRADQAISVVPRDGDITLGVDDQIAVDAGFTVGTTVDADARSLETPLETGDQLWAVATADVQVALFELGV